ncbi:unnamed protein product [Colletotrichum noveboracense]|uniref:Uncharacterized protein n=1 Tax=Colletotrichum noveboracense TaxID=2664923 RepID=A0A9W4WKE6_9PEZI|nr:unnamed protein product [Colletotrichum noveboracense]
MRPSYFVYVATLAAEAVVASPMKAEALPLTLLPKEFADYNKRNQPSAQQLAANGRVCGLGAQQGVCDNGRCGTFIAPTGFTIIRGAESQCGAATKKA